jgi:hypothetical protein
MTNYDVRKDDYDLCSYLQYLHKNRLTTNLSSNLYKCGTQINSKPSDRHAEPECNPHQLMWGSIPAP